MKSGLKLSTELYIFMIFKNTHFLYSMHLYVPNIFAYFSTLHSNVHGHATWQVRDPSCPIWQVRQKSWLWGSHRRQYLEFSCKEYQNNNIYPYIRSTMQVSYWTALEQQVWYRRQLLGILLVVIYPFMETQSSWISLRIRAWYPRLFCRLLHRVLIYSWRSTSLCLE